MENNKTNSNQTPSAPKPPAEPVQDIVVPAAVPPSGGKPSNADNPPQKQPNQDVKTGVPAEVKAHKRTSGPLVPIIVSVFVALGIAGLTVYAFITQDDAPLDEESVAEEMVPVQTPPSEDSLIFDDTPVNIDDEAATGDEQIEDVELEDNSGSGVDLEQEGAANLE